MPYSNNDQCKPRLAIDIGGTFTDIALARGDKYVTTKLLTTHHNPVEAVLEGAEIALQQASLHAPDLSAIIHGTTLATNALIERRGARVGAIVTEGFRDILEIAYERRYDQYDLYIEKPDLIVPRQRMKTVTERIAANGGVLTELDIASVKATVQILVDDGVESLAICLLHSYKNDAHERAIYELIRHHYPQLPISLSSEVSPEIREFDRLCTTVANAYIKPLMAGYLTNLDDSLKQRGFDCPLYMMTSGGGMTTLPTAKALPIRLVESGPSGGAILAADVAVSRDIKQALSFDMGGTTAKVCLIEDGKPRSSRAFEVGRAERFIKGSGLPIRIPVLEMIEIGAGGGSIATVDSVQRLRVGPMSASSDPGPACYGKGGDQPTVTDADAMIGILDPDRFAEGRLPLDLKEAEKAIEKTIGDRLNIDIAVAADGISQIVDEAMANAARMHAVEQGKNLEDCSMIAFGGNGPLHATRVAEKIGIGEIVIPLQPGVASAVGFLSAPVSFELVRSFYTLIEDCDIGALEALLSQMLAEATDVVKAGAGDHALEISRTAFMRYRGQGHEIEVDIPAGTLDHESILNLLEKFEADYQRLFGRIVPGMKVEVMNWSIRVSTQSGLPERIKSSEIHTQPVSEVSRKLNFGQSGQQIIAQVYQRSDLVTGDHLVGPALIIEPQTTTLVSTAFEARIDSAKNIVMTRRQTETTRLFSQNTAHSAIDFQVMWDRLLAVVEEQGQVLIRTAFSPIVRECGDISAGIFAPDGDMLAQAVTGTPGHINTMAAAVSLMLKHKPVHSMQPGDIYMTNDPWLASGHLNDILLVAPVYIDQNLVAFTACTSHLYDLGGLGMGPEGSDIHDEGLIIPPLKLCDRGEISQIFIDILKANSRSPESNEGDLYALMACCDVGARRVIEMMAEFGLDDLQALGDHILQTSRAIAESAIAEVPNGEYHNEMTLDGYDFEITLKATMRVTDNRIVTDFSGSSQCSKYGINVPLNYTAAYSVFGIRCVVGPQIPNNAGSLEPFEISAPSGCIVNAPFPAPVAMRHTIGQIMPDLVLGCLHQALPGKIPAEGASCMWDLPLRSPPMSQLDDTAGTFAIELTHNGGTGARPQADGLSATAYPSGVWGSQVEITESIVPVNIRRRELITDSGGAGMYRGGLGQIIELESSEAQPILLFTSLERMKYPARGRELAGDGRLGLAHLRSGKKLAGKGEQVIPKNDLLVFETPGGGGYGNPIQRDIDRVNEDVIAGLISREKAETLYGVVIDEYNQIDMPATEALRNSIYSRKPA